MLTIYLAGTGMTWNDHDAASSPWNNPELLATLYTDFDNSVAIEHGPFDILAGVWPPLDLADTDATHFKYFVNGAGTSALTLVLDPALRLVDLIALIGSTDPDLGTRNWHNIEAEALNGLINLLNKYPGDTVILNLVGFSRGGVSALRVAHLAATDPRFAGRLTKINILAFDPVPGGLDPVAKHAQFFVLDPQINQYVGIYAEDERTYQFEPIIPEKTPGSNTSMLLLRAPGSHETMVGNRQLFGHSVGFSGLAGDVDDYRVVAEVSQVIVEQLFTSPEWGSVPLTIKTDMYVNGGVDTSDEFATMVDQMWSVFLQPAPFPFSNYHNAIQQTSFLAVLFGGRDLLYTLLNKGHELRVPTPISIEKRLAFVGDDRRPFGAWVWGYGGFGAFVFNSEVVYWLENKVPRITASTWDTLQSFRGAPPLDVTSPVPNVANLAAIEGQCSVTVMDPPQATDNVDGVIDGTTTDPLTYSEQGEYMITWTFTDSSQNTSTQTQQIIVNDDLPPIPDTDDPETNEVVEGLPVTRGQCSAEVVSVPTATDNCSGPVIGMTADPLIFTEQGMHEITWSYVDDHGNETTQVQSVVVQDTIAPVIDVEVDPAVLWRPDHKLVRVTADVDAVDNCSAAPAVVLTSIASNQSHRRDHGHGKHRRKGRDVRGAAIGTEDYRFRLRADTNRHGKKRIYTITYTATDDAGNSATGSAKVKVRRKRHHAWNDDKHWKNRRH